MSEFWYVIQTAPQRELASARALRELGYVVYTAVQRKRLGKREVLRALFPRYIFVLGLIPWNECNPDHRNCIRDKSGRRMIIGPVTICGRHEPIADHEVGKIAEAAARLDIEVDHDPKPSLRVGEIGIMSSGPFEGKKGEIVAISGDEAKVAMRIFNSVRVVRAKIGSLKAA